MSEKLVLIPESEYIGLLVQEARLEQLNCNGVDNWGSYGCMCRETGEDECIFCTEDEHKFIKGNK